MPGPGTPLRRSRHRTPVDILYVIAGTTAGLRQGDAVMLEALARCGVRTASVTGSFSAPERLRSRIYASDLRIDVYESLALSRATQKARVRYAPRAVMYSTTHAALLQPPERRGLPTAIRFDTPIQLSRQGRRYAFEHRLERRRFERARVLLPWGLETHPDIAPVLPASTPVVPLPPVPIVAGPPTPERDPIAVVYAGSPGKKGLELVVEAWRQVPTGERRLVITGISESAGRRYLVARGLEPPEDAQWPGLISNAEFRALTRRAEIYLSASTYENYGIAQLEAMADGALLVTVPSEGPFAALALARRLAPELVSAERTGDALAGALRHAVTLPDEARRSYRERAAAELSATSERELETRLRTRVLPLLLDGDGASGGGAGHAGSSRGGR